MKKYSLALLGAVCIMNTEAQNHSDMLLYSQQHLYSTARSQGVGGAFGSIGADYSSTYLNPAGLGLYRRNDFHFSGAISTNQANAQFLGSTQNDYRTNFNIPSFGLVATKVNTGVKGDATSGIVSYSFAFGHNRIDNYQQNSYMQGRNSQSSVSDYYIQQANGIPSYDIESDARQSSFASLAWKAFLIDTADNNSTYYSPYFYGDSNGYNLLQSYKITSRGAKDEYNFTGAININNMVYIGGGLVFMRINRRVTTNFVEGDPDNTVNNSIPESYIQSTLERSINTTGTGIAGRFGIIFRPVDFFKFGLAMQTRSRINMETNYTNTVTSNIANFGNYNIGGPEEYMEYELIMPARYTVSASAVLSRWGFVSADVEMVDYSKGKLADERVFEKANNTAKNMYTQAFVVRLGTEIKLDDYYRLRAGYNMQTSPYATAPTGISTKDLMRQSYSLGFGYTNGTDYIDFAAVASQYNQFETPYVVNGGFSPTAKIKNTLYNFTITYGVRF